MAYRDFFLRTLTVAVLALSAVTLWHVRQIVLMLFLAVIIAIALNIPVKYLQHLGVGRGVAIALTVFGTFYGLFTLSVMVVPDTLGQLRVLAADLPDAAEKAANEYETWRQGSDVFRDALPEINYAKIQEDLFADLGTHDIDLASVSQLALPVLGDVSNFLLAMVANLLIIFFVSIFLLVDPMDYLHGSVMLVPESYRNRFLEVISELRQAVVAWLLSVGIAMIVTSVSIWVGMGLILHIPNARGIAMIAAASTIIPNVGSVIPFIPIIIFTVADDPAKLLVAIPMYILIQQVEANVITPQVVERQLAIPAAMTMVFQLISAILFGFLGILLAVPILAVVVTLVRELYVYDVLGFRGVKLDISQDAEGHLYATPIAPERDGERALPLTLRIRLKLEPFLSSLRVG